MVNRILAGLALCLLATAVTVIGQFQNAHENAPAGFTGPTFQLSQDYPTTRPTNQATPWKVINFRTNPEAYPLAVRNYAYVHRSPICSGKTQ